MNTMFHVTAFWQLYSVSLSNKQHHDFVCKWFATLQINLTWTDRNITVLLILILADITPRPIGLWTSTVVTSIRRAAVRELVQVDIGVNTNPENRVEKYR